MHDLALFGGSFVALWIAGQLGASLRRRHSKLEDAERENLDMILALTLTLLALITGFSFSMAVSRYDQRKNFEEAEANAIGTEYVRATLLPAAEAAQVRALLRQYLEQRVLFYEEQDERRVEQINAATAQLQDRLWTALSGPATAQPTPVMALVVQGMNDVLNAQGYTQAAFWNRIPLAAWALLEASAFAASLLVGYKAAWAEAHTLRSVVLPLIVAIAFYLIAELDSPRHGLIQVNPENMISLAQSLPRQ